MALALFLMSEAAFSPLCLSFSMFLWWQWIGLKLSLKAAELYTTLHVHLPSVCFDMQQLSYLEGRVVFEM